MANPVKPRSHTRALAAALLPSVPLLALTACGGGGDNGSSSPIGGGGSGGGGSATCSLSARQDWARDVLNEWYLFPELLNLSVNKSQYSDVQSYIDALVAQAAAVAAASSSGDVTVIGRVDAADTIRLEADNVYVLDGEGQVQSEAAQNARWRFAFAHYPADSNCYPDDHEYGPPESAMRAYVLPLLWENGFQGYFSGHQHCYERFDFDGFSLIYLRNAENDFELELTVNRGTTEAYDLGNGYGHLWRVPASYLRSLDPGAD